MNYWKKYIVLMLLTLCVAVFVIIWKINKNDNAKSHDIEELKLSYNFITSLISSESPTILQLNLSYNFITQEEIRQIGKMQSLKKLSFLIKDEDIDLSPLENLIYLEELEIQSCIGECYNLDTQPLGELKNLREVSLMYCSFDTSFLAELTGLEKIFILKCDEFENLSVIENLRELQDLYIEYANDSNLIYLKNLTKLEKIHIVGENIRNFEVLSDMENMKNIYLSESGHEKKSLDMSVFSQMDELEAILIAHINIKDISPLAEMKNLEYISLINTGIADIQSLANLKQLKTLDIFGNNIELVKTQAEKYFQNVETIHISNEIPYPFSG